MFKTQCSKLLLALCVAALLATGCTFGNHIRAGDAAYQVGDYETAVTEYERAAARRQRSAKAAERLSAAKQHFIDERFAVARELIQDGDYVGSVLEASRLWQRLSNEPAVLAVVEEVSNAAFSHTQKLRMSGDFAGALGLLEVVTNTLPTERERAVPYVEAARSAWADTLRRGANDANAAGRAGDALLQLAKAVQLIGDPTDASRVNALRATVTDRATYRVQIAGQGASYSDVAAAVRGVWGNTTLHVVGSARPGTTPDAQLRVDLGRVVYTNQQRAAYRTEQYQSGTRLVENDRYRQAQERLLREERELMEYENNLSQKESDHAYAQDRYNREASTESGVSSGADYSVRVARDNVERARRNVTEQRGYVMRAREELAREPQLVEEPVYSDHAFEVVTVTREGRQSVELVVEHADGRRTVSDSRTATVAFSDEVHDAQPLLRLRADPLDLPGNERYTTSLTELTTSVVREAILASFNGWRANLLADALARSGDRRVDELVHYVLTDPDNVDSRAWDELSELRNIPDVATLLRP